MNVRHSRHVTGRDDSGAILRPGKRRSRQRVFRYLPGGAGGVVYDTRMIPMLCDVVAPGWSVRTDPAVPTSGTTWVRDNYEWTYDGVTQPNRVTYTTEIDVTNDRNALSYAMGYSGINWTWRTLHHNNPLAPIRITTIAMKANVQQNISYPAGEQNIPCQFRVLIDSVEARGWTSGTANELLSADGGPDGIVLEDFGQYTARVRVDVEVDFNLSSFDSGFTMNISRSWITGVPEFRPRYVLANPTWSRCVEVVGGVLLSDPPGATNYISAVIDPVSGALLTNHGVLPIYLGYHPVGTDAFPVEWPWFTWTSDASLGDQDAFGMWHDAGSQTFRRIRRFNHGTQQSGTARVPAYIPASGTIVVQPCGTITEQLELDGNHNSLWVEYDYTRLAAEGGATVQADRGNDDDEQIWTIADPAEPYTQITKITVHVRSRSDFEDLLTEIRLEINAVWTAVETFVATGLQVYSYQSVEFTGFWSPTDISTMKIGVKTPYVDLSSEPHEFDRLYIVVEGT